MAAPAVIADMEWEESLLPPVPVPAGLEAYVRRQFGVVPGWLARVAPAPWLARAWAALVRNPVAHLPPALCDLVALVVSQDNSCRYCFGAQRAVLRLLGYREAYIARLERDFLVAELSAADQAALDFARRVSRADPRPQPNDGPYAPVVAALDGSPAARVLRRAIDDAWASEVLPRRTKTLVFAVVARALGCARSEAESRVALEREGLGARDVDEVL